MTGAPDSKSSTEEQSKRTATSLILFEEVDVIFDDDSGFLAAVKTFMTTTKRPVILTTSGEFGNSALLIKFDTFLKYCISKHRHLIYKQRLSFFFLFFKILHLVQRLMATLMKSFLNLCLW